MVSEFETLWNLWQLRKSQWFSRERLRKLQEKKLRAVVRHAYEAVEFYHRRFRSLGLKPDDIKTVSDLSKLPFTTRKDLIENFPAGIVARGTDIKACLLRRSAGSTGTPVEVVFSKKDQAFRNAVFYRAMFECGLRVWDKLVTGSYYEEKEIKWFQYVGFLRRRNIQPTLPFEETIRILREYQPHALYLYASYLHNLAVAVKDEGIKEIRPRLIFSHAELLDDKTRVLVNNVFDTMMFETYGSSEFIRLAWECPEHIGLHMDADGYFMEFLNGGETAAVGERGEIFVTSLNAYAMPLLRYTIGDYGVPLDDLCPCGRGLPLMKNIEGRADDFILLPDGRLISPRRFTVAIWNVGGVGQYRVIQKEIDRVVVEFTKGKDYSENTRNEIVRRLREAHGMDLQVEAVVVDSIPTDKSGKLKKVVSEIK